MIAKMESTQESYIAHPSLQVYYSVPQESSTQVPSSQVVGPYVDTNIPCGSLGYIQNVPPQPPSIYICRGCLLVICEAVFGSNKCFELIREENVCFCCEESRNPGYLISVSYGEQVLKARDITKRLYWMELRDGNEREASILSMLDVMMTIADLLFCHSSTKP
ncbi:hypothetical protein BDV38DRAFT_243174 [Aspergillus pseudotamarii]|uniref:Uncharacterized protein n=1 Tax=Aspergillus pseudotamarii TaxID=132259 RepID=A0A5N6SZW6_ASPPS|nr:uncharacterized protein BDV38DRAFT_243174 [Aspergillus pseudotamarii]KAE8139280.1 hypothetical protein BDV38DRAFT_243174 [Aspergillus pseudotamarii]